MDAQDRWLNSDEVAERLRVSNARHFRERVAPLPDFPAPSMRLGRPRWRLSDVDAWMEGGINQAA